MFCGVVTFSSLVNFLLTHYSFPTMFFFIGLITGIIPHVYANVKQRGSRIKIRDILLIFIPFVLLITLSFLGNDQTTANPQEIIDNIDFPFILYIFFAGAVAAAALIIPAISGSFILLVMGLYPLAIYTISLLRIFLTDMGNITLMLDIAKVAIPLGMGIITGLLLTARLI